MIPDGTCCGTPTVAPETFSTTLGFFQLLILHVMRVLGHKNISNTLIYTQLVNFKDDQFEVTTATTIDEAKTVLAAGYDYVTEKNGIMLFRKPKRFKP